MSLTFLNILQVVVSGGSVLFVFDKIFRSLIPTWGANDRGFSFSKPEWEHFLTYSALFSGVFSTTIWFVTDYNFSLFLISLVLSYALIFSSYTDIRIHKAPKEVANYSIVFAFFIFSGTVILSLFDDYYANLLPFVNNNYYNVLPFTNSIPYNSLINMVSWLLFLLLIVIVSRGGLGMADVRLFVLLGVTMVWWVGLGNFLFIFGAMNILQALFFIPAKFFNWGQMIKTKSGKMKRALPFIPVIAFTTLTSFLIMSFFVHTI